MRAVVAVAQAPLTGRSGVSAVPIVVEPGRCRDRDPRPRQRDAPDQQHHDAGLPGRPAPRLRGLHARPATGRAGPRTGTTSTIRRERRSSRRPTSTSFSRPEGWAIQRVYHRDGSRDRLMVVRHGDLVDRRPGLPPVRGDPGLRRLLPQRARRRPPDDGQHRRSGPGLGAHPVADDGGRSARPARDAVTARDAGRPARPPARRRRSATPPAPARRVDGHRRRHRDRSPRQPARDAGAARPRRACPSTSCGG